MCNSWRGYSASAASKLPHTTIKDCLRPGLEIPCQSWSTSPEEVTKPESQFDTNACWVLLHCSKSDSPFMPLTLSGESTRSLNLTGLQALAAPHPLKPYLSPPLLYLLHSDFPAHSAALPFVLGRILFFLHKTQLTCSKTHPVRRSSVAYVLSRPPRIRSPSFVTSSLSFVLISKSRPQTPTSSL